MSSYKSSSNISPENASRLQTRTMTLAQSNSKLIYDGGEASMYIRVDSKLNKLAVNTLRKGLGDSIKGDLKVIELTDVKHLSKVDYKRELMSVVVISEFPDNVKYMNSFMKNEAHQESFHVIFKCDSQQAFKNLRKIQSPRLKLVTTDWDQVQSTIEDIYTQYYKKLVQFKGQSKVNNKYYDIKTQDIVLNLYYPSKCTDVIPYIAQLQKRGSKVFKSIHFVKYDIPTDIIKRDILRTKTKKTMTKMLTVSHTQMQASKPQESAMKQIAQINQTDKNIIISLAENVEQLEELTSQKANYQIVVLNTEKDRQTFFKGFFKVYKDPSEQNPIVTCHRLILLISQEEDSLIQYAHQLTEIDQTVGVSVYSGKASLIAELFLVGENSNNFGLLVCSEYDWKQYQELVIARQIKNVKLVILSEDGGWNNEQLVAETVSSEDELCQYLENIIQQRQQYYDPVRGINGDRIHIYFPSKQNKLQAYVQQGILGRKRLEAHRYLTLQDLQAYVQQTISIDGVLIVCQPNSMNSIIRKINQQKNVKLIVYGNQKQAQYNPQVINYCSNKQQLLNFLLNIPNNQQNLQSLSDLLYDESKLRQQPFLKQDDQIEYFIPPMANRPLVYVRLPNKLEDGDSMIFDQRMKKQLGVDLYLGIYERIADIRNLTFREEPLSFIVATTEDMKWVENFVKNERNCTFEILLYTKQLQKGKKLLKYQPIKLVTSSLQDVEHYILGRVSQYENILYGPLVEYQYGNFPVYQNQTVILYYPSGNQKLKLQLEGKRQKSKFMQMAMMVPYDNLTELQKSLGTYNKNTKILIYANEIPESGWETAIQSVLRQYSNPNFALVTNRQGRSIASYCKYSSNRLKKCTQWISNIPVSKVQKTRVSLKRNSKVGRLSKQIKPILKPIQIAINKIDPKFSQARDISLWNTNQPLVKYSAYNSNQDLISFQNKAVLDTNKKYLVLMDENNVPEYLNTFKNSCTKLIVQSQPNSQIINHQNILYQASPNQINQLLINPFRDKIQYPEQFYYKNLKVAAHSELINPKQNLSSNGLSIQTYNTSQELNSLLRNKSFDLILSRNIDNVDPKTNKVVLVNTNGQSFQQNIPYEYVGTKEDVAKYLNILSFLKKSDLKSLHEGLKNKNAISINQFPNKRVFQKNYNLILNPNDSDLSYGQQGSNHVLQFGSKQFIAPSVQHIQQVLNSIPNYNKLRLMNTQINNKPCLLFDDERVMKDVQLSFNHLTNNIKYQPFSKPHEIEKLLSYSPQSSSFVFSQTNPNIQMMDIVRQYNSQLVLMNNNQQNHNLITASSPNTVKRIINLLNLNKVNSSKMRAQTIIMIPKSMNSGQFSFCASNLQQSTHGSFQIQQYQTPQNIPDIKCNNMYVVSTEQMLPRVSSRLFSLTQPSNKNIILKVMNQTFQTKQFYKSKYVDFVTDNETEMCEFILTQNNIRKQTIPATSHLLLPSYYEKKLGENRKLLKNIKMYNDQKDIHVLMKTIPSGDSKYIVLNKFNSSLSFDNTTKVFFQGSARFAPTQSISHLTPGRLIEMFDLEQHQKKLNAVSDVQYSYTLNKRSSSKSIKQQKVASIPLTPRQQSNTQYIVQNHYYLNNHHTNIQQTARYPVYEQQRECQYYSYRTTPLKIKQVVLQPVNFPQKFTKNPSAKIVYYKNQDDLKQLIARFSTDSGIKVTIQRYTRFQQYQIPPVPKHVRPALMQYFENQLEFGNRYNIPDFSGQYYQTVRTNKTHQVSPSAYSSYSSDSFLKQHQQNSSSSINLFNEAYGIKDLQIISQTQGRGGHHVYYKHPNHKFIPTHFDSQQISFTPYSTAQQLIHNLSTQLQNNAIIIQQDSDIISIQQKLGKQLSVEFIRVLRSDFNDFASLPNNERIVLETSKQQSVIDYLKKLALTIPSPVVNINSLSLNKKGSDMFSQLSTNIV